MRCIYTVFIGLSTAAMGVGASACLSTTSVECADGRVCPQGTVCDVVGKTCVVPGGLVVRDEVLNLGTVSCGTSTLAPIEVANFGTEPLSFSASSTLEMLTISPSSGTVQPGERMDVVVTADVTDASVSVGTMEGAVYFTTDTDVFTRLVTATIAGGVLTTSVNAIDFGIASLDQPSGPREFTVENTGNSNVTFTADVTDQPFSLVNANDLTIEPNGRVDVEVRFAPQFTGAYDADVSLSFRGALCQEPPEKVELSGTISDAPLLVNTTILDFGTTACGVNMRSEEITFTSNAATTQTLSFDIGTGDVELYSAPAPVVLTPGGQVTVVIERNAIATATPGSKGAKMSVTATPSGETIEVSLQHEIVGPLLSVAPNFLEFQDMAANSSTSQMLVVANLGNSPASIGITPARRDLRGGGKFSVEPDRFSVSPNQTGSAVVSVEVVDGGDADVFKIQVEAEGQCDPARSIDVSIGVKKTEEPKQK